MPEIKVESDREVMGWTAATFSALALCWLASNALFWGWWLDSSRVGSLWMYSLFTLAFGYEVTFLPSIYLYYLGQMRRPRPVATQDRLRVALVTLCVPSSESLDIIVREFEAMSRVTYPHESWVLDEGNDPMVRAAAARLGVRYFSRAGIAHYNQATHPFKAKTKAGNMNAWLNAHGQEYDFFVQYDIDHLPRPEYLDEVLGYFRDPQVAWVQAPSVYGNLDNWVARGAAEQELVLQGPLQQGFFGTTQTPFIIGSHCTYRMTAINAIGGFQPTRAEDHLDTVVLASRGYRGVFVPKILAVGNGPDTFETYLRQQFAWAYSMMQVLFSFTPGLVWHWRPRQATQFLFAQSWYVCSSTSMAVLFFMPMLSLLTGRSMSTASLLEFAAAWAPINLTSFAIWWWSRRWHRPIGLRLSWRGVVLQVARWPIVLWAFINVIFQIEHPYMVTPKSDAEGIPRFSMRSQLLYLALTWLPVGVIAGYQGGWWSTPSEWDPFDPAVPSVQGSILLALWGVVFVAAVVLTNFATYVASLRRSRIRLTAFVRVAWTPVMAIGVTLIGVSATMVVSTEQIIAAATAADPSWAATIETGALQGRAVLRRAATGEPLDDAGVAKAPVVDPRDSDAAIVTSLAAMSRAAEPARERPAVAASRTTESSIDTHAPVAAHAADPSLPVPPATDPVGAPPIALAPPPHVVAVRAFDLPTTSVAFGMYDPWQAAGGVESDLEHWYIRQDEPRLLQGALRRTRNQEIALVTVEPFPRRGDRTPVLDGIVDGRRDGEIRRLAQVAREASPQVVLLRWGHEMELSGLYPWSANHPELYQQAFRHVVGVFRAEGAENVRWVWSPAGNAGLEAYYPGDDVVDYLGVTVLGDPGWDANFGLPPQSFSELLRPKYDRLARYGKPIIVAEFGVSGPPERQASWLEEAGRTVDQFPLVRAVSYFNDVNAENNRLSSRPDWRIAAVLYAGFIERSRPAGRWLDRTERDP